MTSTNLILIAYVLIAVLCFSKVSPVYAGSSDSDSDDGSDDGGQVARVGNTADCEQCSDVGGKKWSCSSLSQGTSLCYQPSNFRYHKWRKKGFCLQTCADLDLPHPHKNCCKSNPTADNASPRGDTCSDKKCSEKLWRGKACADIKNLARKCTKNWFQRRDLCRQSCYEIGQGYPGDECCGDSDDNDGPVVDDSNNDNSQDSTTCDNNCSDNATPWMISKGRECKTWNQLPKRCNSNHGGNTRRKDWWIQRKWCQQSCSDIGMVYDGEIKCCENRGGGSSGDVNVGGDGITPTAAPFPAPTRAPNPEPTASPTFNPTNDPTTSPTGKPTQAPNPEPTTPMPSPGPSAGPSASPTDAPTTSPTPLNLCFIEVEIECTDSEGKACEDITVSPPSCRKEIKYTYTATNTGTTCLELFAWSLGGGQVAPNDEICTGESIVTTRTISMDLCSGTTYTETSKVMGMPVDVPGGATCEDESTLVFVAPTLEPTSSPTTLSPTIAPNPAPTTKAPTARPSKLPSSQPSSLPSQLPSQVPTPSPTSIPTSTPTCAPVSGCIPCSNNPSPYMSDTLNPPETCETWKFLNNPNNPDSSPCLQDASNDFIKRKYCQQTCFEKGQREYYNECGEKEICCTKEPTSKPSLLPSKLPSHVPTPSPTDAPNPAPTTLAPTSRPSKAPSAPPSSLPSNLPSQVPTPLPTSIPTSTPTCAPVSRGPNGCVECTDDPSPYMINNTTETCETWNYLRNTDKSPCLRNDFRSTFCQQTCFDLFQTEYVNDCGKTEVCCTKEPTSKPTSSPVAASSCNTFCTNKRYDPSFKYMVNNNLTCDTWKDGLTVERCNLAKWKEKDICQYSCFDKHGSAVIRNDERCCDISENCVPCNDSTGNERPPYMIKNNITTCETWGGVKEDSCNSNYWQNNKFCQRTCYAKFAISFDGEICCPY